MYLLCWIVMDTVIIINNISLLLRFKFSVINYIGFCCVSTSFYNCLSSVSRNDKMKETNRWLKDL